jgi:hypothetical protein
MTVRGSRLRDWETPSSEPQQAQPLELEPAQPSALGPVRAWARHVCAGQV